MNPGDQVRATLQDTPAGFMTTVTDLTTRQTGFMVASEAKPTESSAQSSDSVPGP